MIITHSEMERIEKEADTAYLIVRAETNTVHCPLEIQTIYT
jgi:hypothetical protein